MSLSPTPAFDSNNIASIQAAMQPLVPDKAAMEPTPEPALEAVPETVPEPVEPTDSVVDTAQEPVVDTVATVDAQDQPEDAAILDAILRKIRTGLNDGKATNEIKASLEEEYIADDLDELIQKGQSEFIEKLKKEVEEVRVAIEDKFDTDDGLHYGLEEIEEGASFDEVIRILRENRAYLYESLALPNEAPKFGKVDGPLITFTINEQRMLLDEDGRNVHNNKVVKLEPWMQERFEWARKERAENFLRAEEYEKKQAQIYEGGEYPVRILPPGPGPHWDEKIPYGIAGDIVQRISTHCEAHPAGMLVDLLVSFGCMIGRGPYFSVNETEHYTNEFVIRVGDSSTSRKGTGRDVIDKVLKQVDPTFKDRITSGFGSAEAIINQIRDSTMETRQSKVKGVMVSEQHLNRGVDDKRLFIREGEAASILVLADKKESFASVVLRNCWDGQPLRNIVKGKTAEGLSNSAKCESPHVSISGDTTIHELRARMPKGADENGFANRFLFPYVCRTKECPNGGPRLDWSARRFEQLRCKTLRWAKTVKHVSMTDAARQWWCSPLP